jgi:hypothetical protein
MSFKEQFLKMPPGPAREAFIYNAIIGQGPPRNLVPVTVTDPNGVKITYKVMPDYVMIEGIRVPMSPVTAQRVAKYFGMSLPTAKMSQQIYDAADTKVRAPPLSGSGYTGADGKRYSAQDVVESRIGASDAAIVYNEKTDKEIAKQVGNKPPTLIAGHGKDILEPLANNPQDVSMGGWQGSSGNPLQPYSSPHKGQAAVHSEYALYTRLVGGEVTVTLPNGKTITTTMEKLRSNPDLAKLVANKPGMSSYQTKPQAAEKQKKEPTSKPVSSQYHAPKPQSGRMQLLQRIDSLLEQIT